MEPFIPCEHPNCEEEVHHIICDKHLAKLKEQWLKEAAQ